MSGEVPYRKQAMEAAIQLGYGVEVVRKIEKAKTDEEIRRIMTTARNNEK